MAVSRRLESGHSYHFNIIYNHARSSLSSTADTELSLSFAQDIVARLDSRGFDKSYYYDRDALPGRNIFQELFRVINSSDWTIVILTEGFLKDCWSKYSSMAAFKTLLDKDHSHKLIPIAVDLDMNKDDVKTKLQEHTISDVLHFTRNWEQKESEKQWSRLYKVFEKNVPLVNVTEQSLEAHQPVQEHGDGLRRFERTEALVTHPVSSQFSRVDSLGNSLQSLTTDGVDAADRGSSKGEKGETPEATSEVLYSSNQNTTSVAPAAIRNVSAEGGVQQRMEPSKSATLKSRELEVNPSVVQARVELEPEPQCNSMSLFQSPVISLPSPATPALNEAETVETLGAQAESLSNTGTEPVEINAQEIVPVDTSIRQFGEGDKLVDIGRTKTKSKINSELQSDMKLDQDTDSHVSPTSTTEEPCAVPEEPVVPAVDTLQSSEPRLRSQEELNSLSQDTDLDIDDLSASYRTSLQQTPEETSGTNQGVAMQIPQRVNDQSFPEMDEVVPPGETQASAVDAELDLGPSLSPTSLIETSSSGYLSGTTSEDVSPDVKMPVYPVADYQVETVSTKQPERGCPDESYQPVLPPEALQTPKLTSATESALPWIQRDKLDVSQPESKKNVCTVRPTPAGAEADPEYTAYTGRSTPVSSVMARPSSSSQVRAEKDDDVQESGETTMGGHSRPALLALLSKRI